jgi:hypothetical protein
VGRELSLLGRLTASAQRLDAAELETEVGLLPCAKLKTVTRGEYAVVAGRLRSVVYNPKVNVPVLEAELFDGSAAIQLVWLGRRSITGIEPGRRLLAKGRVGLHDGQLAIYNPWYELTCPT